MARKRRVKIKWKNLAMLTFVVAGSIVLTGMLINRVTSFFATEMKTERQPKDPIATVYLDPGHGGYDNGAIGLNGEMEKEINLQVSLKVASLLRANNISVYMSRESDKISWAHDNAQDIQYRIDDGVAKQVDLFISIHANSSDVHAYGLEVWHTSTEASQLFAESMAISFSDVPMTNFRGLRSTKEWGSLMVLDWNPTPAVLIELGFMNNAHDLANMVDDEAQNSYVAAIVRGILLHVQRNEKVDGGE